MQCPIPRALSKSQRLRHPMLRPRSQSPLPWCGSITYCRGRRSLARSLLPAESSFRTNSVLANANCKGRLIAEGHSSGIAGGNVFARLRESFALPSALTAYRGLVLVRVVPNRSVAHRQDCLCHGFRALYAVGMRIWVISRDSGVVLGSLT